MRVVAGALLIAAACGTPEPARPPAETTGAVEWNFKGRAAIPDALAEAARLDRPVLVGLSGGDS